MKHHLCYVDRRKDDKNEKNKILYDYRNASGIHRSCRMWEEVRR